MEETKKRMVLMISVETEYFEALADEVRKSFGEDSRSIFKVLSEENVPGRIVVAEVVP